MKPRIVLVAILATMAGGCNSTTFETGQPAGVDIDPLLAAMADPAAVEAARCGDQKVLVCHVPPGNPDARHTICIGEPAVEAHLTKHHGGHSQDSLGDCTEGTPGPTPAPTMAPTPAPTAVPAPSPTANPDPNGGNEPPVGTPAPSPGTDSTPAPTPPSNF